MDGRIDEVELRVLEMPLVHPFQTSFGTEEVRHTVVVSVAAGGLRGWGESPVARFPGYAYETVETALHVLGDILLPGLVGEEMGNPLKGEPEHFRRVRGHAMAKSGVIAALCDLEARARGISLSALYGGERTAIDVGVSIGIQPSPKALMDRIRAFCDEGYGRIKIKIEPGWDLKIVERVRTELGELPLWVDANQAYGPEDFPLFAALDSFGLGLIEQPFAADDLKAHGELARRIQTKVCLDESVVGMGDYRSARALKALDVLNIKACRVGGPLMARALHDAAREEDVPVWCGGMLETGIGRAHNIALASLPNFVLPADLSASARYFHRDIIDPPVTLAKDGRIAVPQGPGLGVEVNGKVLEKVTVRTASFH